MPHQKNILLCALCPHWHCIHGTVGQCRFQQAQTEADSVFAYPTTHENQVCLHGQTPVGVRNA